MPSSLTRACLRGGTVSPCPERWSSSSLATASSTSKSRSNWCFALNQSSDATVEILLSERRTCHQEEEIGKGRLLELLILSRADERVEDAAVVGDIAEIEVVQDLLLVLQ
jgi:hypothetical protein